MILTAASSESRQGPNRDLACNGTIWPTICGELDRTLRSDEVIEVFGKFGEILQGVDQTGAPILVTGTTTDSPFRASFRMDGAGAFKVLRMGIPSPKAEEAALHFLKSNKLDPKLAGTINITTNTPIAKGLGSSSQDTAGSILTVARWFNLATNQRDIYRQQCLIERSDLLLPPNSLIVSNPITGEFSAIRTAPQLLLLGWDDDPGHGILTSEVAFVDLVRRNYADEFCDLRTQLIEGDDRDALQVATRSAEINNQFIPKSRFEWAKTIAHQYGGGVVVAHTGTWIAISLLAGSNFDPEKVYAIRCEIKSVGLRPTLFAMGARI